MLNLEPLAVTAAAKMVGSHVNDSENMINKSLMVLAEQGVCAFGLFLASRSRPQDIEAAKLIHIAMNGLLLETGLIEDSVDYSGAAEFYKNITSKRSNEDEVSALQRLLLTKQLMETTLTYGRYQAKARAK